MHIQEFKSLIYSWFVFNKQDIDCICLWLGYVKYTSDDLLLTRHLTSPKSRVIIILVIKNIVGIKLVDPHKTLILSLENTGHIRLIVAFFFPTGNHLRPFTLCSSFYSVCTSIFRQELRGKSQNSSVGEMLSAYSEMWTSVGWLCEIKGF